MDAITLLKASGQLKPTKHFHGPDYEPTGRPKMRWFTHERVPVSSLDELAAVLRTYADADEQRLAVRGEVVDSAPERIERRKIENKGGYIKPVDRRWVMVDIDKHEAWPEGSDPRLVLPECFHGAACLVQYSSSHGIDPGLNAHLWFWLDRPVCDKSLEKWAEPTIIDHTVMRTVQEHFIASPVFTGGAVDPVPDRFERLDGAPCVVLPDEVVDLATWEAQAAKDAEELRQKQRAQMAEAKARLKKWEEESNDEFDRAELLRQDIRRRIDEMRYLTGARHPQILTIGKYCGAQAQYDFFDLLEEGKRVADDTGSAGGARAFESGWEHGQATGARIVSQWMSDQIDRATTKKPTAPHWAEPEHTLEDGEEALREAFERLHETRTHALFTPTAGTGKTYQALRYAAKEAASGRLVVFFCQTSEKAEEAYNDFRAHAREAGITVPTKQYKGRNYMGLALCSMHKPIELAYQAGLGGDVAKVLCSGNPDHDCDWKRNRARIQELESGVIFAASVLAHDDFHALPRADVYIVDEYVSAARHVVVTREDIANLDEWTSAHAEARAELEELIPALLHGGIDTDDLELLERCARKAARGIHADVAYTDTEAEALASVREAAETPGAALGRRVVRLVREYRAAFDAGELRRIERTEQALAVHYCRPMVRGQHKLTSLGNSDGRKAQVIGLDATGDPVLWAKTLGIDAAELEHVDVRVKRKMHVTQCVSRVFSKRALLDERGRGDRLRDYVADAIEGWTRRRDDDKRKVLCVACKPVRELLELHPRMRGYQWAHFGALRGLNAYEDCDVVIIGREQPRHQEAEREALALGFDIERCAGRVPKRWRGVRTRDGVKPVEVPVHPDENVQRMWEQMRECELVQAIDRARGVRRERSALVLTSTPFDVTVDVCADFKTLRGGDPLHEMARRGLFFESPTDAHTAYPDLFATAEGAKKALERGDDPHRYWTAQEGTKCIKNTYAECPRVGSEQNDPVSYVYKRGRNTPQSRVWLEDSADAVIRIRAALGESLHFCMREDAMPPDRSARGWLAFTLERVGAEWSTLAAPDAYTALGRVLHDTTGTGSKSTVQRLAKEADLTIVDLRQLHAELQPRIDAEHPMAQPFTEQRTPSPTWVDAIGREWWDGRAFNGVTAAGRILLGIEQRMDGGLSTIAQGTPFDASELPF